MGRRIILVILAGLLVGAPGVSGHQIEVVGTVVSRQNTRLDVKTKDGQTTSIALEQSTLIFRNQKRVDVAELKPGVQVEVHALDDAAADLVAYLVDILPTTTTQAPAK